MNTRPILFSAPMVRALLQGRKTQTRRVVRPLTKRHPVENLREYDRAYSGRFNDPESWGYAYAEDGAHMELAHWLELCPYGTPGDLLWVRETWREDSPDDPEGAVYSADEPPGLPAGFKWKPSIFMPRWASRLTLRITDVRVQRLQDISEADAAAEGLHKLPATGRYVIAPGAQYLDEASHSASEVYGWLWDDINGPGSWDANPWVWAISFDVRKHNVDQTGVDE